MEKGRTGNDRGEQRKEGKNSLALQSHLTCVTGSPRGATLSNMVARNPSITESLKCNASEQSFATNYNTHQISNCYEIKNAKS